MIKINYVVYLIIATQFLGWTTFQWKYDIPAGIDINLILSHTTALRYGSSWSFAIIMSSFTEGNVESISSIKHSGIYGLFTSCNNIPVASPAVVSLGWYIVWSFVNFGLVKNEIELQLPYYMQLEPGEAVIAERIDRFINEQCPLCFTTSSEAKVL